MSGRSLGFGAMAELYDATRTFDRRCFAAALDFLVERFPPSRFGHAFEPGIGTGRIAIPLAERGYRVTGVDISDGMLATLDRRLSGSALASAIAYQHADVRRLPFADATFDLVVVVHLFYFVEEWKRAADEVLRVVRRDGPVILMHTGTGAEIPFLNEQYKELCAQRGCTVESTGVKSTREVVDYYQSLGCHAEWIRDRWRWTARIRLDEALGHLKARAYSFATIAPDSVHLWAVEQLEVEQRSRFGRLAVEVGVENQAYLALVRRG